MRQIVILDGYVANPGDISWAPIEQFGEITYYKRTAQDQVIERARDAEILLINKIKLGEKELSQLPKLKLICITASGMDNVDLIAAEARKIQVKNAVGYGTTAVAQHVFALLLQLTNHVSLHHQSVSAGEWAKCKDFCYTKATPIELADKKLGIYGFGKIAQQVAKIAYAFGMHIHVVSRHARPEDYPLYQFVDTEELFSSCDVVSLHAPLTEENKGIVNAHLLQSMRPGSLLINTARGGLINEKDLQTALKDGPLAAAALDVLGTEPPPENHPLAEFENCIITPHMAWMAKEARERLIHMTAENIAKAFS